MKLPLPSGPRFLCVTLGVIMSLHGLMKLLGGVTFLEKLGSLPPGVPNHETLHLVLGTIAMAIELVGGLMVALGYRVRMASLGIVTVLLIAFSSHFGKIDDFDSFMRNTWPLEIAFVFTAIALMNPGRR